MWSCDGTGVGRSVDCSPGVDCGSSTGVDRSVDL